MALSDELAETLAGKVHEKQGDEPGTWIPYVGPDDGEGWQNMENPDDVRYQEEPPGEVSEGVDPERWTNPKPEERQREAVEAVFDNVYADKYDYRSIDHAAARLVMDGKADADTVTDVLVDRSDRMGDGLWTTEGRIAHEEIGGHTTGPTDSGVNMPIVTDDVGYPRRQVLNEFENEIAWGPHITEIVHDGINEWQLGMFTEECAPMFQLASEITGNETLPEDGAHGDDEEIPSVMEMAVTYEEKEAFEAKMEQTQDVLREAFGDTITVYRGISPAKGNPTYAEPSNASDKLTQAAESGETAVHEHRPIESWTTDAQYASQYAKGMAQGHPEDGVIMKQEVPVDRVMASSHTSPLSTRESEVIVMHDEEEEYQPENIIPSGEISDRWLVQEALDRAERQGELDKQNDIPDEPDPEADSPIHISAEEVNPEWLHETDGEVDDVEKQSDGWVPYVGPEGGEGWQDAAHPEDVRYQTEPPGETADGYDSDYWEEQSDVGYYDEEAWSDALWEEGWTSPGEVPEGTAIEFETNTGATATGLVEGVEWGQEFEDWPNDPASLVVDNGDAEFLVGPGEVLGIIDAAPDDTEPGAYNWDTDIPRVDEIPDGSDVLYTDSRGIRRVGIFESPTFVEGADGTYSGVELDDGTKVRLEQVVAVDEGPVPLQPREDPYNFESERDPRDIPPDDVAWEDALQYTPFDSPGEVPLGATIRIDANNHPDAPGVNGTLEGEVTGYWDGDAEINEPNGLEVEVPDHGAMIGFPSDVAGFVGPDGDLDTAQYLGNPFEHAVDVTGSREAGIGSGNTTGGRMKILTMPDESRIFATPIQAYDNITTGVVSGSQEARRNNLNSPTMINHLGGNACKTALVEGRDGKEYIAKEGIEGDLLSERQWDINDRDEHGELIESLERSLAAAFFVGNQDLHGANIMVNVEAQEATIIDHDAAGPGIGGWIDVYRLVRDPADTVKVEDQIFEICRDYMNGETDIPDELDGTYHKDHFKEALESIVNDPDHSRVFAPWESSSHEPVDGFDRMSAFEQGMEVTVLTETGRVRQATLTDQYQGSWYGETDDNYEVTFDMPHHVLEVHGDVDPAGTPENRLRDFTEGDRLTVSGGLSNEDVVVEEYDDQYDRLRVHPEGDPQDVFHVDMDEEIEDVLNERVSDFDELDMGEKIEVEGDGGESYSGTFMGYTDGSDGDQIEIQDQPGRIVTVDSPREVRRLAGESQ